MRLLFVSDSFPYPPESGTRVRDYNLIRCLAERCELGLLAFTFNEREIAGAETMRRYCEVVGTVRFQRQSKWQHLPGVVACLLKGQPLASKFVYSPEFAAKLRRMTTEQHFDVVQIDCTPMAPYVRQINSSPTGAARPRTALVFIDVNAHKFKRLLDHEHATGARLRWWLDWRLMRHWEARYAENFDACVMMSDVDAQRVRQRNPRLTPLVIPNGVDVREKQPLPDRPASADILLIGTLSHAPWADAVRYFHAEIFPLIKLAVPQARLLIVGNAPPEVQSLAADDVIVTGRVDEIQPYYEQACVAAVPLRSGGGTRLKILESLAYGRPVVTTSVGCEGLDLRDGADVLLADEPRAFADAVSRLLTEPALRHSLARHGRYTVEQQYSWDIIADRLLAAYEQLGARDHRRTHA